MTLLLDAPPVVPREPERTRWRRRLFLLAGLLVVALVAAWVTTAQRAPLEEGSWAGGLDARQLEDGLGATRYVVPVGRGEQVVLTSVRNDGPAALTVLGLDAEGGLPYLRASFRDVGASPAEIGYPSSAAAKAAVTASSVTLAPGDSADVLVAVDPRADVRLAEGSYSELRELRLSVRYLGLTSTQVVPLLPEPLAVVGTDTFARLQAEGRFAGAP